MALDPSLPALPALRELGAHVARVAGLVSRHAAAHAKASATGSAAAVAAKVAVALREGTAEYQLTGVADLTPQPDADRVLDATPSGDAATSSSPSQPPQLAALGLNRGAAVALAVVCAAGPSGFPPATYVMADEGGRPVAVSLYHLDAGGLLNGGAAVLVRDPEVVDVAVPAAAFAPPTVPGGGESGAGSVGEGGEVHRYRCIQVKDAALFLVNGKPLRATHQSQLRLAAFDQ